MNKILEHIAAAIQLINIAAYYNSMFPNEKKDNRFYINAKSGKIYYSSLSFDLIYGEIFFTQSASKQALSNPNVVEVLQKYFRIK